MKNYLTNKRHPFGEGHRVEVKEMKIRLILSNAYIEDVVYVDPDSLDSWMELDLVSEIQEPKWTDDDCKDLIRKSIGDTVGFSQISDYAVNKFFDEWKKSKQL